MQSEDQQLSQLVGDCMLAFTHGITTVASWEDVPAAWQILPHHPAYTGKLNPLGVSCQPPYPALACTCLQLPHERANCAPTSIETAVPLQL